MLSVLQDAECFRGFSLSACQQVRKANSLRHPEQFYSGRCALSSRKSPSRHTAIFSRYVAPFSVTTSTSYTGSPMVVTRLTVSDAKYPANCCWTMFT